VLWYNAPASPIHVILCVIPVPSPITEPHGYFLLVVLFLYVRAAACAAGRILTCAMWRIWHDRFFVELLPPAERFVKKCTVRTVEDTRGVEKSYSHGRRSFCRRIVTTSSRPILRWVAAVAVELNSSTSWQAERQVERRERTDNVVPTILDVRQVHPAGDRQRSTHAVVLLDPSTERSCPPTTPAASAC